ncbi:DUF1963 domain-containing protein [Streptacidiphilus carbonis]|uniref:DUF1963 domain-containing protein n=1 Tax=Streptacidiphilus carbonis TaxID=105422 RepID=UPI00126A4B4B|nr:DUF1963 domain-containing protein [Streptacidiphilus carbonis]
MSRTTAPRPVDVEQEYPALAPLALPAIRLHPRRGEPTASQSSLGGMLLWPADEPWPMCPYPVHERSWESDFTDPVPLVPVVQLLTSDVPQLPHPAGADVLQLLWCPYDEAHSLHEPVLLWRDSAAIGETLSAAPAPQPLAYGLHVPIPCTVSPEQVVDYPYKDAPEELLALFEEHDAPYFEEEVDDGRSMWEVLQVFGCKVGGYPFWTQDPQWPDCSGCGSRMQHLLCLMGDEGDRHWIPREEWATAGYTGGPEAPSATGTPAAQANRHPLDLTFGDNGSFFIFACTDCPDMPTAIDSDCH